MRKSKMLKLDKKLRPWLKYYGDVPANMEYPNFSMVDLIIEAAEKYPNNMAYSYYGSKVSYKEFIVRIKRCAKALKNYGVKDWGFSLCISIISLILAIILLWTPQLAGLTAVLWLGMAVITSGLFAIFLSFQLKKIKDLPNNLSDDLKRRYAQIKQEIEDFRNQ